MRTQAVLRSGVTDTMHMVANMVSSCRSCPSSSPRVASISSAGRPASTSVRQATRRQTPSAASAGPRPQTSPIRACTQPSAASTTS